MSFGCNIFATAERPSPGLSEERRSETIALRVFCLVLFCLISAGAVCPVSILTASASPDQRVTLSDSVYNLYVGNLHSHTSYSDGKETPAVAFAYGRDSAGIDFLAVTDHHNDLTVEEYNDILYQADVFTENGVYVAIGGQEWTGTDLNHSTVWCADSILTTLPWRYDLLYGELVGLGLTAAFCHPLPRNWGFFAYSTTGDTCMNVVEVRNLDEEERYIDILSKGWHVGTDGSQDNHGPNWGNGNSWTVALACSLTRDEIIEASRDHRTYSTLDRNLQMIYKAEGHYMGDEFAHADDIEFSVEVLDPDTGDDFKRLELYQNGLAIAWTEPDTTSCIWEFSITPPNGYNYYFVKASQMCEDRAWSAPIWIDCTTSLPATPRPEWPYDGQIVGTVLPDFAWHASSGAESYTLHISDSTEYAFYPPMMTISGIADTFCTLGESLEDDVVYYWRVVAVNENGASQPSGIYDFLTDADASSVPGADAPPPAKGYIRTSPNPFRDGATVEFYMERAHHVDLVVYDVMGKTVRTLYSGTCESGPQTVYWDGADARGRPVSQGVYLLRLRDGRRIITRKAALLR